MTARHEPPLVMRVGRAAPPEVLTTRGPDGGVMFTVHPARDVLAFTVAPLLVMLPPTTVPLVAGAALALWQFVRRGERRP